jgi:hypothetical protein
MKSHNKNLRTLLITIDTAIQAAKQSDLSDTATLLRLARLDLMLRAQGLAADDITPKSQAKSRLARIAPSARSKKPTKPR